MSSGGSNSSIDGAAAAAAAVHAAVPLLASKQQSRQPMGQYLHPDYLELAPSQTDPKQSPLALLVKTCDNIGRADASDAADCVKGPPSLRPHQRHSPPGRRVNGSRPPSVAGVSAFESVPLKRPASPLCPSKFAGDDLCGRPLPAKQRSTAVSASAAPQTPQAEFCIFCGRHCPTPEQLVRHMRSHEAAAPAAAATAAPIPSQLSPFSSPPPQLPTASSHHQATLAYAAAAAMQQQQQQQQQPQQQMDSMRKWAAAAAAAAAASADQRYHPYRSLLNRLPFPHFGATPLV